MRLLFLVRNFRQGWGGAPESVRLMARQLATLGYRSDVLDGNRLHRLVETLALLPLGTEEAPEFSIDALRDYSAVLHVGPWQSPRQARAILARLGAHQRYLYLPRGGLADIEFEGAKALKKGPYFQLLERRLLNAAEAIIFSSEAERRASRHLAGYAAKGRVIPDFFDWAEAGGPAAEASARGPLRIGFLGEISRRKGLHPFIAGALHGARTSGRGRRLRLRIGGAPRPGAQAYLREAKALSGGAANLEVEYLGAISHQDRPAFYASIDALAVPSLFESYGLTVLEGLACGKPVLCSEALGVLERLPGNPDVLRFEDLSPMAIAAVLDTPSLHAARSQAEQEQAIRRARDAVSKINAEAGRSWRTVLEATAGDAG